MEAMMRQMQESMKLMQQAAVRQAEFAKQQAASMAQQAELITRLQQQNGAPASHQAPPTSRSNTRGDAKCPRTYGHSDRASSAPNLTPAV